MTNQLLRVLASAYMGSSGMFDHTIVFWPVISESSLCSAMSIL